MGWSREGEGGRGGRLIEAGESFPTIFWAQKLVFSMESVGSEDGGEWKNMLLGEENGNGGSNGGLSIVRDRDERELWEVFIGIFSLYFLCPTDWYL